MLSPGPSFMSVSYIVRGTNPMLIIRLGFAIWSAKRKLSQSNNTFSFLLFLHSNFCVPRNSVDRKCKWKLFQTSLRKILHRCNLRPVNNNLVCQPVSHLKAHRRRLAAIRRLRLTKLNFDHPLLKLQNFFFGPFFIILFLINNQKEKWWNSNLELKIVYFFYYFDRFGR